MSPATVLFLILALLATALFGVLSGRRQSGRAPLYGASFVLSVLLLAAGAAALLGDEMPRTLALPIGIPWIGAHFRIDALSAFFLIVVNLGGAMAAFYGIGYGRHETERHRVQPFFPAFLAGMNLVVLADDAFVFLFSWELMSLASWAMVMTHHRDESNRRAGFVYLVMAIFGTLTLLLSFGLLAGPDGAYAFAAMRDVARPAATSALILILVLAGAGSKAGIVPLHVWLPLAHPAAPSHVSALMSGVMTKVAIYGFIRIVFDILGPTDWWLSIVVLVVGGATAVLGVLYALMQHDLKRLLAYHTVENVGIIFIGLGLALAFRANALPGAAALALTAALFHIFNHSLFKSLLFFGAGAVLTATGERDMEKLGGLIHRMPTTAFLFLVGSAAISALPPLNGFVSEWLTFQAVLQSPELPQWGLKIAVPAVGSALALSAALAAACFVKAFGITFLGRPRSEAAAGAREVDRCSIAAMAVPAALCLLAGTLPGMVTDALAPATDLLLGDRVPVQGHNAWLTLVPISAGRSSYNGAIVFLFIALSASAAVVAIKTLASRRLRRAPAWDCGFPDASPANQYTAGSFAQPIRRVYGTLVFSAREQVTMPPPGDTAPATLRVQMKDPIWDRLYAPLGEFVVWASGRMNALQFLTIRQYLSLVFLALVSLLVVLAL